MPKTSVLQFNNYKVEEMSFKSIHVADEQHEFELHPYFKRNVVDCGGDEYDVHLSVEIDATEEHPMPFQLKVALVGHFVFSSGEEISPDTKKYIIQRNTVSILFPFLRSIVASLTTNANIPTLLLPVMNFNEDD